MVQPVRITLHAAGRDARPYHFAFGGQLVRRALHAARLVVGPAVPAGRAKRDFMVQPVRILPYL